jgi:shikimate dehydrogenase
LINGNTILIAHLGHPTAGFKAPMIYNPYFDKVGINAVVMPMGVKAEDYESFLRPLFRVTNVRGALITMPLKVKTAMLLDDVSIAVKVAGSCNAILKRDDGTLFGDMFDGEGFVRAITRKGGSQAGKAVLIVGNGGVGSAIAASFAGADVGTIGLVDIDSNSTAGLAQRLRSHYPEIEVRTGSNDPTGFDVVVNATPLGMSAGDPMPLDVTRINSSMLVGEVVMRKEMTAFLSAAKEKGCQVQIGLDMLFEQIPAYLEFFGFPTATPDELRAVAEIKY